MCVNDLVVQGAEPLFFLDYFACGHLDTNVAKSVVASIAAGCKTAGCALIGGETAEMPGMYADSDYDLAGFAVGAAERGTLLNGEETAEGDVVLGLQSSGIHSNGYSLVRKVVAKSGLHWTDEAPFDTEKTLADCLLTPTRIYVKSCLAALKSGGVHGLAHITGGGLPENLPRVFGENLTVEIQSGSWPNQPISIGSPKKAASVLARCCEPSIAVSEWLLLPNRMQQKKSSRRWRRAARPSLRSVEFPRADPARPCASPV